MEDEQDVMNYVMALFEDNGYETVSASGGIEGFMNKPIDENWLLKMVNDLLS